MRVVKLKIGFLESDKLDDFVEMINEEDDLLADAINATTALLAVPDEYGVEWLWHRAAQWFDKINIEIIK